jgi:hypothetical protein
MTKEQREAEMDLLDSKINWHMARAGSPTASYSMAELYRRRFNKLLHWHRRLK